MRIAHLPLLSALALLPALAMAPALRAQDAPAAQPAPAVTGPQIIVRGRPDNVSRGEVQVQANAVAAIDDPHNRPLARFEDRLCPGIIGMQEDMAMLMIDRIRDNARQLGVRVQDDGCMPNMIIAFSGDSLAAMENLVDRNPLVFQRIDRAERMEILQPGPVHVFNFAENRTRDGLPISDRRNMWDPPVSQQAMAHSKLYTSVRRDITSVTIIFDIDEMRNISIGQLADYATMRGLAQTRRAEGLAMNSILTLFDPQGPYPESLTDFDRAYLRALYDGIPNLPAAWKLGNVNRELNEIEAEAAALAANG